MPIVTIKGLKPREPKLLQKTLQEVRRRGAAALNCAENNIWVIFESVDPECFVRTIHEETGSPEAGPIVIIQANRGRPREVQDAFLASVESAISDGLSIPGKDIWIYYQEIDPANIWQSGRRSG
jgi:phenylpyruvate tautomerase PptA (4-oxalocrotonate tautomerase family)